MPKAYLIQRIEKRNKIAEHKKSVDRHFGFEYMGSAEFEFGQLPKTLKKMIAEFPKFFKVPKPIKSSKHVCYFVGEEKGYEEASLFFEAQLKSDRTYPLKESSFIDFAYKTAKNKDWWELGERTIGWWCVDLGETPPWVIFKHKENAELWLKEIKSAAEQRTDCQAKW
jgi:hypothetical protein